MANPANGRRIQGSIEMAFMEPQAKKALRFRPAPKLSRLLRGRRPLRPRFVVPLRQGKWNAPCLTPVPALWLSFCRTSFLTAPARSAESVSKQLSSRTSVSCSAFFQRTITNTAPAQHSIPPIRAKSSEAGPLIMISSSPRSDTARPTAGFFLPHLPRFLNSFMPPLLSKPILSRSTICKKPRYCFLFRPVDGRI